MSQSCGESVSAAVDAGAGGREVDDRRPEPELGPRYAPSVRCTEAAALGIAARDLRTHDITLQVNVGDSLHCQGGVMEGDGLRPFLDHGRND